MGVGLPSKMIRYVFTLAPVFLGAPAVADVARVEDDAGNVGIAEAVLADDFQVTVGAVVMAAAELVGDDFAGIFDGALKGGEDARQILRHEFEGDLAGTSFGSKPSTAWARGCCK